FFVPSGGGQWAVQGPIMIPAALEIGADTAKTAMGVAWGDAWTNSAILGTAAARNCRIKGPRYYGLLRSDFVLWFHTDFDWIIILLSACHIRRPGLNEAGTFSAYEIMNLDVLQCLTDDWLPQHPASFFLCQTPVQQ